MEFLLRRTDDDYFIFKSDLFPHALSPISVEAAAIKGWGDYRLKIANGEISFSFEEPGIQIVFEKYSGSSEEALKIVQEILENIEKYTGQRGKIIEL